MNISHTELSLLLPHPRSPISHTGPPAQAAMSPSFSPALSPLATRWGLLRASPSTSTSPLHFASVNGDIRRASRSYFFHCDANSTFSTLCHDHSLQLPCLQVAIHITAWGPDGQSRDCYKGRRQQYSRWIWNQNMKTQSILDFLDNLSHIKWFWWPMLLFQGEGDIISLHGPPTMEGTLLWKGEEEGERRWGFRISRSKPVQN